ncbi:unnamed protein product [Lota lota]
MPTGSRTRGGMATDLVPLGLQRTQSGCFVTQGRVRAAARRPETHMGPLRDKRADTSTDTPERWGYSHPLLIFVDAVVIHTDPGRMGPAGGSAWLAATFFGSHPCEL